MRILFQIVMFVFIASAAIAQSPADSIAIVKSFDSWNRGWADKNVALAIESYSDDVDWTNAFGDRFIGKDSLKKGSFPIFIFSIQKFWRPSSLRRFATLISVSQFPEPILRKTGFSMPQMAAQSII